MSPDREQFSNASGGTASATPFAFKAFPQRDNKRLRRGFAGTCGEFTQQSIAFRVIDRECHIPSDEQSLHRR